MSKVFLDPGHGGYDSGAVGYNLLEKTVNLNVALVTGEVLVDHGVSVLFSRKSDIFVELIDRATMANNWGADYFVSIHSNASNGQGYGTETFYYPGSTKGKELAQNIQNAIVTAGLSRYDRGIKTANFSVLRNTKMPSSLVELGFIDNQQDNMILSNKQEELGIAIAKGILKQLGIPYRPPVTPTPTNKYYRVSIGAYKEYSNAVNRRNEAIAAGFSEAYILKSDVNGETLYRVILGAFTVYENAVALMNKAKAAGFTDAYIYYE